MGCDLSDLDRCRNRRISIHAPQWGATEFHGVMTYTFGISIHAPQWGATGLNASQALPKRFQSTHPSGVRHVSECLSQIVSRISIHAPQWGATRFATFFDNKIIDFNPRTPVGCDLARPAYWWSASIFQSTHPSGVRLAVIGVSTWTLTYFNPRTPVGCDGYHHKLCTRKIYFNPRTPVGCDEPPVEPAEPPEISIHAPQWGATREVLGLSALGIFQSTHPSGVRPREWA